MHTPSEIHISQNRRDQCFAHADVALEEAVHKGWLIHVIDGLVDGLGLRFGERLGKRGNELVDLLMVGFPFPFDEGFVGFADQLVFKREKQSLLVFEDP